MNTHDTTALQHLDHDKKRTEEVDGKEADSYHDENRDYKKDDEYGDTSDGKVNWTKTQIAAAISLSDLWVGQ